MNDLPQNELLSAYLDGELTAAEQAEIERLLAASPAARQLLDELRALSSTLQSLPQEKLGEDISGQVLRVAERRMLAEGSPGETESAPTPLVRSVARRFLNRRTIVWLSLTAAVAVMISINERRQGAGPMFQAAREVARAPLGADNRVPPRSGPPPTIQAASDREDKSLKEAAAKVEMKSAAAIPAGSPAPAAEPATLGFRATAPAEKPADQGRGADVALRREGVVAGAAPTESNAPAEAAPAALPHSVAKQSAAARAKDGEIAEKRVGSMGGGKKSDAAGERMVVIHCRISPEAANGRAFEKLLAANGLAWHEQRDQTLVAGELKEETLQDAKQPLGGATLPPSTVRGKVNLIVADATPAQLDAILTGLTAQPNVFLSFSVHPTRGELPQDVARLLAVDDKTRNRLAPDGDFFQYSQRTQVAGPGAGRGAVGQLEMEVRERAAQQPQAYERQHPVQSDESTLQTRGQEQQQVVPPASRQRVLFVLHVVGGDRSPAAAKAGVAVEADTAPPAEKAAPAKAK